MSIELKKAVVLTKKNNGPEVELDLNVNSSDFNTIISEKIANQKYLVDVLTGKKIIKKGTIKINENDKINKFWAKKHITLVKGSNFIDNILHIKTAMTYSLILNREFFLNSKSKLIQSKYEYLSFKTAKGDTTDIEMREKIDLIISKFISSTAELESQWVEEFHAKMSDFHDKKISEVYGEDQKYIKNLIKDYADYDEKVWGSELYQTFLQSLWDKVHSFLDLSASCHCEYNSKTSKNKEIRNKSKNLDFHHHAYVVRKYLKQIEIKIYDIKRFIFKAKFVLSNLMKRIFAHVNEVRPGSNKEILKEINSWRKSTSDQRVEFVEKQEQIFFNNLLDDSLQLRGKIVEIVHAYHQKVLTNALDKMEENEYKRILKEKSQSIKSIHQQAVAAVDKAMNELEIVADDKKKNNKSGNLNAVYLKILKTYFFKKDNLILWNVFDKLNRSDSYKLLNVLNKLREAFPKLTIIMIEKNFSNIVRLKSNGYLFENGVITQYDLESDMLSNFEKYNDSIFYKYNKLIFEYVNNSHALISSKKVKLSTEIEKGNNVMFLNPFLIKSSKKDSKNIFISYNIKCVKNNIFKDPNMMLGVNNHGNRFYFYTGDLNEEQNEIFLSEDAIVKIM